MCVYIYLNTFTNTNYIKYSSLCYTLGACCLFYIWECVYATPTFLTYWDKFILVILSLNHVCLFVTPWTVAHQAPLGFPGKNTRVGCHCLLQGIFPTQGSNPHLLHWQADSLPGKILYHCRFFTMRLQEAWWVQCAPALGEGGLPQPLPFLPPQSTPALRQGGESQRLRRQLSCAYPQCSHQLLSEELFLLVS